MAEDTYFANRKEYSDARYIHFYSTQSKISLNLAESMRSRCKMLFIRGYMGFSEMVL